jgi:hypothetical protein
VLVSERKAYISATVGYLREDVRLICSRSELAYSVRSDQGGVSDPSRNWNETSLFHIVKSISLDHRCDRGRTRPPHISPLSVAMS